MRRARVAQGEAEAVGDVLRAVPADGVRAHTAPRSSGVPATETLLQRRIAKLGAMARERLVGSILVRFTEHGGVLQVRLQDLRTGRTLEFETWVAAWACVDEAMKPVDDGDDDLRARGPR